MNGPFYLYPLTRVALAVAHCCGSISLAPLVCMSVPDYFDSGGPFAQLEPFRL